MSVHSGCAIKETFGILAIGATTTGGSAQKARPFPDGEEP